MDEKAQRIRFDFYIEVDKMIKFICQNNNLMEKFFLDMEYVYSYDIVNQIENYRLIHIDKYNESEL